MKERGDGAGFSPLGKWSLEATVLMWYPGEAPTPSSNSTAAAGEIFRRRVSGPGCLSAQRFG
jgi:hypothetical protein